MAEAKGPKTEKGREVAGESWRRGAQVMGRVMGMKLPSEKPEGVGPYLEATVEDLFANVWSRDGALSVRDRRLLVLAVVTCMGQQEYLKLHLAQAHRQGELSPEDHARILEAHADGAMPPGDTPLGGQIGIHGEGERWRGYTGDIDWTFGCVAVTDPEIEFIAERVAPGTPVEILP